MPCISYIPFKMKSTMWVGQKNLDGLLSPLHYVKIKETFCYDPWAIEDKYLSAVLGIITKSTKMQWQWEFWIKVDDQCNVKFDEVHWPKIC